MMAGEISDKIKKIKLVLFDVDGVLTKGEIIYDELGRQVKVFNVKDGLGAYLLSISGIKTAILTARNSRLLKYRARDMKIDRVFFGLPKENKLKDIQRRYKITAEEICFVGDDIIDIKVAEQVGFSVAVKDAAWELKKVCDYVTQNKGGEGAVREVAEIILKTKGLWQPFALPF